MSEYPHIFLFLFFLRKTDNAPKQILFGFLSIYTPLIMALLCIECLALPIFSIIIYKIVLNSVILIYLFSSVHSYSPST